MPKTTLIRNVLHGIHRTISGSCGWFGYGALNLFHKISTYDVSPEIAQIAAEIRANYNVRTPDAIQLGTAVFAGANFFLTNDQALKKFSQIEVLTVDDLA